MADPEPEPEFPKDFWKRATRRLDQRERRIIIGVFRDGVQQLTLAAEFDVSKQRVGELHKRALMKLRKRKNMKLRAYLEAA
jgi:DNA-directed RNA polymerase specialized sigma subunit